MSPSDLDEQALGPAAGHEHAAGQVCGEVEHGGVEQGQADLDGHGHRTAVHAVQEAMGHDVVQVPSHGGLQSGRGWGPVGGGVAAELFERGEHAGGELGDLTIGEHVDQLVVLLAVQSPGPRGFDPSAHPPPRGVRRCGGETAAAASRATSGSGPPAGSCGTAANRRRPRPRRAREHRPAVRRRRPGTSSTPAGSAGSACGSPESVSSRYRSSMAASGLAGPASRATCSLPMAFATRPAASREVTRSPGCRSSACAAPRPATR